MVTDGMASELTKGNADAVILLMKLKKIMHGILTKLLKVQ